MHSNEAHHVSGGGLGAPAVERVSGLASCEPAWSAREVVTIFGVVALTFMMTMYALEHRNERYVVGFAIGCLLSSCYGFLSGAWPFGVVEAVWAVVAVRRFTTATRMT